MRASVLIATLATYPRPVEEVAFMKKRPDMTSVRALGEERLRIKGENQEEATSRCL